MKSEIEHWRFLDDWEGYVPWRKEKHLQINIATDASLFRWAGVINDKQFLGDFFTKDDVRPIHIKEAEALLNTLLALESKLKNHRVDAYVDNQVVVASWEAQGSKSSDLNSSLKKNFHCVQKANIDLHLHYIPSSLNPADSESRRLSMQDCTLTTSAWKIVQEKFGPHSVDLMATDCNAMRDESGNCLKHFTPCPTPKSAGVNIFAQNLSNEVNPYVFPPFCLISAILKFLVEQKLRHCTFVFPELLPLPHWWPLIWSYVSQHVMLGKCGDLDIILGPSSKGFTPRKLRHNLHVAKLVF